MLVAIPSLTPYGQPESAPCAVPSRLCLIEERSSSSQVKAAPAIRAAMSPSNVSLALLRGETVKDTAHAKAIVAELSDMMLNRSKEI